jgi:hypothetical protein
MMSRRFQIGAATLSAHDPQLAPALADAHARRIRPLCLCRKPAAPLYVARVAGQFIPKRMPGTGPQHDPGCESYEAPPELSGFGDLVGRAIQEDVDAGVTVLRLGFSLSRTGPRPAPGPVTREADSVKADASKLSLQATLHYLWEEAGFHRWSERMIGKRTWFVIRKHLLQAAENKIAKGAPLADMLYIPEVFSAERKAELMQRHLSAVNKIASGATGPRRLMLLIGEVKEFAAARSGHKLVVKHLPGFPFLLREGLHRRMTTRFERELTLWDAVAGAHLLAIATFGVGSGGVPDVEELALMVVTETWIPIEHIYDSQLVEALTRDRRRFLKGLRYNLPASQPLAATVLSDVLPSPIALYIVPPGAGAGYRSALDELVAESPLPAWIWNAGESAMPVLPQQERIGSSRG